MRQRVERALEKAVRCYDDDAARLCDIVRQVQASSKVTGLVARPSAFFALEHCTLSCLALPLPSSLPPSLPPSLSLSLSLLSACFFLSRVPSLSSSVPPLSRPLSALACPLQPAPSLQFSFRCSRVSPLVRFEAAESERLPARWTRPLPASLAFVVCRALKSPTTASTLKLQSPSDCSDAVNCVRGPGRISALRLRVPLGLGLYRPLSR